MKLITVNLGQEQMLFQSGYGENEKPNQTQLNEAMAALKEDPTKVPRNDGQLIGTAEALEELGKEKKIER